MIVSPYDAELYGHWWFEGPQFLKYLIEKIHYDQDVIRLATPIDYLREYPENQEQVPSASTCSFARTVLSTGHQFTAARFL